MGHGRGDADRWSDLDLVMFTQDRARYAEPGWLHTFGTVWLTYVGEAGLGDPEWFAIYEGGLKVDVVLLQVEGDIPDLKALLGRYPYKNVFARGVKVLFDRYGTAHSLSPDTIAASSSPSAVAFDQLVSECLLESVTAAKFVARGDFWRAQHWLAYDLRPQLLKLIEWHANGRDTWYDGRFIDSWADPRVLAALPQTFASCDRESLRSALKALLALFWLLGEETAERFGYSYPASAHHKIAELIDSVLSTV